MGGADLRTRKWPGNGWRINIAGNSDSSKTLTHEELDALRNPHGLRRISHYYRSHAVSAIYQYH